MGFYDEEVKRVCLHCPRLLIMAVNGLFGKQHDPESEVHFLNGELPEQEHSTFMDMLFHIKNSTYHLEFQLLEDDMAIRMYEYAVQETIRELKGSEADQYEIDVVMPEQAVIFLAGANKKDVIRVNLMLPDRQKVSYQLKCVSASKSVEQLSEEGLYILIPFQQVQENRRMNRIGKQSIAAKKEIAGRLVDYRVKMRNRLDTLLKQSIITEKEYNKLMECALNIEQYMLKKDQDVEKEAELMGDPGYVAWSDRMREEGRLEGHREGQKESIVKTGRKYGASEENILQDLMTECGLTEEQAREALLEIGGAAAI